ncbi:hypothetical protein Tco_1496410, partial [Tanacetum coccineum]
YGYCKNLKKTVKTGQTRTRERKREYKSPEVPTNRANDWKNDWPGLMGLYNRLSGLEASPRQHKYKQGFTHKRMEEEE